jgi:hypothetical protein
MYRPPTSPVPDKGRNDVDKHNLPKTGADTNAEEADALAKLAGHEDDGPEPGDGSPGFENPTGFTNTGNLTKDEAKALSGIGETTGERIGEARADLTNDEKDPVVPSTEDPNVFDPAPANSGDSVVDEAREGAQKEADKLD